MKKPLLLFACLSFVLLKFAPEVYGQAWSPFLLGETHVFSDPSSAFVSVHVDSSWQNLNTYSYQMNRRAYRPWCYPNDSCVVQSSSPGFLAEENGMFGGVVEYNSQSGAVDFIFEGGDTFHLRLGLPVNSSWTFHYGLNLTATMTSYGTTQVLGNQDSIQTITISNGNQYILSKNHGLIQGLDLEGLINTTCNAVNSFMLRGLDDLNLGVQLPTTLEIFDFAVGDKFEYRTDNIFISSTYERIEILGPRILVPNTDSIKYLVARELLVVYYMPNYHWVLFPPDTSYRAYVPPVSEMADWMEFQHTDSSLSDYSSGWKHASYENFHLYNMQAVPGFTYVVEHGYYPSGCNEVYNAYIDGVTTTYYSKGVGMSFWSGGGPGQVSTMLTCFTKNGLQVGVCANWNTLMGVEDEQTSHWTISPNPARDAAILHTGQPSNREVQLQLWSMDGRLCRTFLLRAGQSESLLDLNGLPEGLYMVKADNFTRRIVKVEN